jgi:hypothetical protein
VLNGAADTAFGDGGLALATVDASYGEAIAVDADGKVVVGGNQGVTDVGARFFTARFLKT